MGAFVMVVGFCIVFGAFPIATLFYIDSIHEKEQLNKEK